MRGLIRSSEVHCNNKNRCPWHIIKKHFFPFFTKRPQRMYSIFFRSTLTPFYCLFPIRFRTPGEQECLYIYIYVLYTFVYIMYCVGAQCDCSKMRHFFSKGQKRKTTEGWRPKVVSMGTVFFLFDFIFYSRKNDNT